MESRWGGTRLNEWIHRLGDLRDPAAVLVAFVDYVGSGQRRRAGRV